VITVEGMPGAGKTTLLGALLAAAPDRVAVFPEAQPAGAAGAAAEILPGLLDEDAARLSLAAGLVDRGLTCLSDRCYIGTLAYRYARAETGRGDPDEYDHAIAEVARRGLRNRHAGDTVLVLRLSAAVSLDRRRTADAAARARWSEWFDPQFLDAYERFLACPRRWAPHGAAVLLVDAETPTAARTLLAATTGIAPAPRPVDRVLPCPRDCGAPRSPVVQVRGADVQLTARSLHHQPPGGTVACLRRAVDIAARWTS